MSKTSLSITGLQTEMTSDEVKQKLAKLYFLPEENFEGVYASLVLLKQPYIILNKMDQSDADGHVRRLKKLGFECCTGDEGLSLAPVSKNRAAEIICPACQLPSSGNEICEQCGVILHKYLKRTFKTGFCTK